MNGWIENNEKLKQKIERHLSTLPSIFTEFYIDMQGDIKSYKTIEQYIKFTEDFMNYITQNQPSNDFYLTVQPVHIKQYIVNLTTKTVGNQIQRTSDDYQALRWSAINSFFKFLMINEHIKHNPMLNTKRPKIKTEHAITYLTKAEIDNVMTAITKNYTGNMLTRDRAIIGLFLATGLRVSALVQINIEDIDLNNNTIKVVEKRMKTRQIPFGENTKILLQDWLNTREQFYHDVDTSALFLSQWRRRITTKGVSKMVAKYTKDLDKHITPHKFRSTAATQAVAAGINVHTIQDMYGHESVQTTMRYVKALDKEKEEAVNIMDQLFK